MNLTNIPIAELNKELQRRKGVEYLETQIAWVNNIELSMDKLRRVKELAVLKIQDLNRGGTFEGRYPVIPEAEEAIEQLSIALCRY